MQPIDLLVSARWVIPVEPVGAVLAEHSVAVAGGRILAVLPAAARAAAEGLAVYAPALGNEDATRERLRVLREATESRRLVEIDYESLRGAVSQRRLRPLGVFYWDAVWTLAAWCEMRRDFRNFRVDRIRTLQTLPESFRDEAGKTLADLLRLVRAA